MKFFVVIMLVALGLYLAWNTVRNSAGGFSNESNNLSSSVGTTMHSPQTAFNGIVDTLFAEIRNFWAYISNDESYLTQYTP